MAEHILSRSITIAVLALVVTAFAGAGWFWLDRSLASPLHQTRECRAAAQIAHAVLHGYEASRVKIAKYGLSVFRMEFDPVLRAGVSREGRRAALPGSLPEPLEMLILSGAVNTSGAPLDCSEVFREQHLPVPRDRSTSLDDKQSIMRVNFSRIVFSLDDRTAYVIQEGVCGPLCGAGWDMRWRREGNSWAIGE